MSPALHLLGPALTLAGLTEVWKPTATPLHHNAASGRLIAVPGPSQDLDLLCGFCVQFHHKSIRYTNWSQIIPMIPILGLTYLFLWLFSIHRTNGEDWPLLNASQVPSDQRNYNIRDNYCRLLAHQSKKFLHQLVLPVFFIFLRR